jgi:DNA phosphorothioation-associated putative methyltransferase
MKRKRRGWGFGAMAAPCCAEVSTGTKQTAMKRGTKLPTTVRAAKAAGIIRPGTTVFDYGEGLGETCAVLNQEGITCRGWDPGHSEQKPKVPADVVMLNFVLNVICDPDVRDGALREAYGLANKHLVIGVRPMDDEKGTKTKRPCGDGWLVLKNKKWTFQKFHSVAEFKGYVRQVLGREARVLADKSKSVLVVVDKPGRSERPPLAGTRRRG